MKFLWEMENKKIIEIPVDNIWDLGYDIQPHHEYVKPENFPDCCGYHKQVLVTVNAWFNSFPYCCDEHQLLIRKKWFNKNLYSHIPQKILMSISYTSGFINHNIGKADWYKKITHYIDYVLESFGIPNIGGEGFYNLLINWIEERLEISKKFEWKRNQLLDFLNLKAKPDNKKSTDLNLLNSTFQKWVKSLPEISLFSSIKVIYTDKLPLNLFLYDGEYNRFTGLTKFKGRTQSELLEILISHTKRILAQITTENVYQSLNISDKEKYEIEVITEKHKLNQLSLLKDFSKKESKYIKVLKKWLKNEKNFIDDIKPLFKKDTVQDFHTFLIQQIFFLGQNLEKFTHLHQFFGEEKFRDYFLPHLNTVSEKHLATGETFNKKGKTDILIQDTNGTNVFVAECKLWKGEAYLTAAINQLLERYVLWRDGKIGLIIFNKDNKKFTEIIQTAKETIEKHELFDSYIEKKFETIFTYKFKHPEDKLKTITLDLILFNFYTPEPFLHVEIEK